ncbi:MAG: uroporphyrinogen decarboxylase [Bryobacterales bacterium]|nr:uroporphyrinogen decarboxylase [Bryobacterales bacterium]
MNGKERILATFDGAPRDHLALMPITMMFAGDTAGVLYRDYASNYRVLAAAQLRTAERYGFDYVSAISDPAREASDLGGVIEWFENQPPAIVESQAVLQEKSRLASLGQPEMAAGSRMEDRVRAVEALRRGAGGDLLVEGWVEGPCAMGADLRGINSLMLDFSDDPEFIDDLFAFVVTMEIAFAKAQIRAGADLIGVGDAASSLVGPRLYRQYVLPWQKKLIAAIRAEGARVRLHICGNTRRILGDMGTIGADLIDLDFPSPVAEARSAMTISQALLGNLDPVRTVRDGTPASVTAAIAKCHEEAGSAFIVGAGCEIARGTPEENILALAQYARTHP